MRYSVGDRVGVGCLVNSCGACLACGRGEEQYCPDNVLTYNAVDFDGAATHGGYSQKIVVRERFVVRVPDRIPLRFAAPLMCAGITLYSPLRRYGIGLESRVAIVGFGGLGHLGTQISAAIGAETTAIDVDASKRADALRLGADHFVLAQRDGALEMDPRSFDLIISTVPAALDLDVYLGALSLGGTMVNLGVPCKPLSMTAHSLLRNRRSLTGSLIGGIAETAEMLEFCASENVRCEIELIDAEQIDTAFDRVERGEVSYRFVIDIATIDDQMVAANDRSEIFPPRTSD